MYVYLINYKLPAHKLITDTLNALIKYKVMYVEINVYLNLAPYPTSATNKTW